MNIGINAAFQARGGSLTNFLQLIRNWEDLRGEHSITLFTNSYTLNALKSEIPSTWKVISIRPNLPTLPGRVLSEQLILPYLIFREKIDVLYCPANITPLLVHQPCVVTFQNFGPFSERSTISALGLGTWLRFQTLKFFMLASAKKAQLVLFGSQHFFDSFKHTHRFPASKGRVIYRSSEKSAQNSSLETLFNKHSVRQPYLLCVSQLVGYKNIIELISAYQRLLEQLAEVPTLVIAGGSHGNFYQRKISRMQEQLSLPPAKVIFTGALPHGEILTLIQNAHLFVFPSTCESCPTALIEALESGVPIICSNVAPMPEIAGQAPEYFNPDSPEDIARCLLHTLSSPALLQELKKRSIQQAQLLPDCRKMAQSVLESILEVGGSY